LVPAGRWEKGGKFAKSGKASGGSVAGLPSFIKALKRYRRSDQKEEGKKKQVKQRTRMEKPREA
jgi:hypothetical protein